MPRFHSKGYLSSRASIDRPLRGPRQQEGVVLIISLVLLLIMTLLGVSNMRSSSVQLSMAVNTQSRSEAFSAAEYTLKTVESELESEFATKHDPNKFIRNCSGSACYSAACTAGLCFEGDTRWNSRPECQVNDGRGSALKEFIWMRDSGAVWKDSARHATKTVTVPKNSASASGGAASSLSFRSKYIIEFLCYTHKDSDPNGGALCDVLSPGNCAPLYRITVLAESESEESRVMLQATAKVNDN